MSAAEVVPSTRIPTVTSTYLDPTSESGRTPLYIARRGRLDGVMLRLDVWEQLRDEATRSLDLRERDELQDRLSAGVLLEGSLGEVAAPLRPPAVLASLPIRYVAHAASDILTA